MFEMIRYDAMCRAIEECARIDEVKDFRDKAEAIKAYARQAKNMEIERQAAEIRMRAERRWGQLYEPDKGGRPSGNRSSQSTGLTLNDMGVSKDQSALWQKAGKVSDEDVAEYVEQVNDTGRIMSSADLVTWQGNGKSVHFSSESSEHYTPSHIIEAVLEVFNPIFLDPCADPERRVPAEKHYTAEDDGLSRRWIHTVYMNPPYGREIDAWVDKFTKEDITEGIALMPARTDTVWWDKMSDLPVCFIRGRLKFGDATNSAPFPSAVFYRGGNVDGFISSFLYYGGIWHKIFKG